MLTKDIQKKAKYIIDWREDIAFRGQILKYYQMLAQEDEIKMKKRLKGRSV